METYITVEPTYGGYMWKLHISSLKRVLCSSWIIHTRYDTAVKDAKRFRKALRIEIPINYVTPTGKVKTI